MLLAVLSNVYPYLPYFKSVFKSQIFMIIQMYLTLECQKRKCMVNTSLCKNWKELGPFSASDWHSVRLFGSGLSGSVLLRTQQVSGTWNNDKTFKLIITRFQIRDLNCKTFSWTCILFFRSRKWVVLIMSSQNSVVTSRNAIRMVWKSTDQTGLFVSFQNSNFHLFLDWCVVMNGHCNGIIQNE